MDKKLIILILSVVAWIVLCIINFGVAICLFFIIWGNNIIQKHEKPQ